MGGSGGSTAYNPCKASPCIILPLGDSITHGYNSTDDAGYRSALFKLIVAANQNVTFVGSLSNGPSTVSGKTFPKNHEGHDGITVTGITGYVPPAKAFTTTPHIVLLHIGTNDMTSNADPTTTANQLDTLVTNLVAAAPDALVVVAKIVPLGYSNTNYTSYIAKIPDVVKAHAAKNQNVIMVDMSTLPTSDIRGSGNVHPTDQGYADMANLWYERHQGLLAPVATRRSWRVFAPRTQVFACFFEDVCALPSRLPVIEVEPSVRLPMFEESALVVPLLNGCHIEGGDEQTQIEKRKRHPTRIGEQLSVVFVRELAQYFHDGFDLRISENEPAHAGDGFRGRTGMIVGE
jgi:lysophospholipase L1-like esterase